MNASYPHTSIWINGRLVPLAGIASGMEVGRTSFETNTFTFISAWISGEKEFAITTSGSTGSPKTIMITRDQMIASAQLTVRALDVKSLDTCLVCIDTKFIGGRMMLVRALQTGLRIFAVDPCPNPLEKIPEDLWVNFAAFVPYQLESILQSNRPWLLNRVTKVIIGGAPLRMTTIDKLDQYACTLWATYGMTETISHIALQALNGKQKQNYFESLPGIELDVDHRNCLILNVPYVSEKIVTNDVVELIDNRRFRWIGRFDNIINTGGVKVNPEKIEATVQRFFEENSRPLRFFIHGMEDEQFGSRVVLVMEANTIDEDFLTSLRIFLSSTLSRFEIPKSALLVPRFSETENGKINRLQTVKGDHAIISLK